MEARNRGGVGVSASIPLTIVAAVLLSPMSALAQPAVIFDWHVEIIEREGSGADVVQYEVFTDSGDEFDGTFGLSWDREHETGTSTGGATATWHAENPDWRTGLFTFSIANNYQYSHNGGWPSIIFGGDIRVRLTPWVLGEPRTNTLVRISNIAQVDDGTTRVTGLVCGGGTWIYREVNSSDSREFELRTCDETRTFYGRTYSMSRMVPASASELTWGNTGPNQDPFVIERFASNLVVFELMILDEVCPADVDGSGDLTVQDIFAFLSLWFAGDVGADFNGIDGITIPDIFDFLSAWFAGC